MRPKKILYPLSQLCTTEKEIHALNSQMRKASACTYVPIMLLQATVKKVIIIGRKQFIQEKELRYKNSI